MDSPTIVGTAGLLLDIRGVFLLFVYTSTRAIEAELSYNTDLEFTDEHGEALQACHLRVPPVRPLPDPDAALRRQTHLGAPRHRHSPLISEAPVYEDFSR